MREHNESIKSIDSLNLRINDNGTESENNSNLLSISQIHLRNHYEFIEDIVNDEQKHN